MSLILKYFRITSTYVWLQFEDFGLKCPSLLGYELKPLINKDLSNCVVNKQFDQSLVIKNFNLQKHVEKIILEVI